MCGTIGMFIGCQAVMFCPRGQLLGSSESGAGTPASSSDTAAEDAGYRSPLGTWHDRAAVRANPRRRISADAGNLLFFSPDLVPVAAHPLVRALPEHVFRQILIQHLYRYLDFTAKLESIVVNRAVLSMALGTVGVRLPPEMRLDAYKIYCDEAYHTLMCADLAWQARVVTGVDPRLPREPFFLRRLAEIQEGIPAEFRALVELLFVIVSETLISATLAEVPDSADVVGAVRETVSDHAGDEGRHHAYFAIFLKLLWAQLTPAERDHAGAWVPRLADAFLRPDVAAVRDELADHKMRPGDIEIVLAEVFPADVMATHRSHIARHTLRYFAELDAFGTAQSQQELADHGFQAPSANGERR
jgi:P-aminobenzoate N-oxygenase AurF